MNISDNFVAQKMQEYNHLTLKISGQRTILLNLINQIQGINGETYNAIKIKGRGFVPLWPEEGDKGKKVKFSPTLMESCAGFGISTSEGFFADGTRNVFAEAMLGSSVKGGMSINNAIQEFTMTWDMYKKGLPVCLPLGFGIHTSEYYQDNNFDGAAFVLLGIRNQMDNRLTDNIYLAKDKPNFVEIVNKMMFQYGAILKEIHDKNFYWGMPHIENICFDGETVFCHDLDNAKYLPKETKIQETLYRVNEILSALGLMENLTKKSGGHIDHSEGISGRTLRAYAIKNISNILIEQGFKEDELVQKFTKGYCGKTISANCIEISNGIINIDWFLGKKEQYLIERQRDKDEYNIPLDTPDETRKFGHVAYLNEFHMNYKDPRESELFKVVYDML